MKYNNNISQEEWEEIENYLSGNISTEEKAMLEARLASDPAFRQKFAETRLLLTGIRESSLQQKLDSFHQSISSTPKLEARKGFFRPWMAAAAVLLATAITTMFLMNRSGKNEKLFAQYFQPDPGLATAMGSSEDYEFNRGMIDYRTGNYQPAIEAWRKLAIARPANDTLHYFLGLAFLSLHQTDSAVQHLEQTIALPAEHFRSDAHWYLALALLRQNKKQEAIPHLNQTVHPGKDRLLSQLK